MTKFAGNPTPQTFWNGALPVGVHLRSVAVVVEVNAVLKLTRVMSGSGFAIRAGAPAGEIGKMLGQMIFKVEAEED